MIKKYNDVSLMFGIPGILMQIGGNVVAPTLSNGAKEIASLGGLLILIGTVLLMIGLAFYAKAKGRSPWFCLLGFLSIIGLLALACLSDKTASTNQPKMK